MIKFDNRKQFSDFRTNGQLSIDPPETIFITKFNSQTIEKFKYDFDRCFETGQDIIPIYIDSPGGQVTAVLGIMDIVKASPIPVATIALGQCASAGSLLLTAGTEGHRFASPNAEIMIHEMNGGVIGPTSEIENYIEMFKNVQKKLYSIYDKNCKQPAGTFRRLLQENKYQDKYLSANQAKKLNIVNHVGIPTFRHIVESKLIIENINKKGRK